MKSNFAIDGRTHTWLIYIEPWLILWKREWVEALFFFAWNPARQIWVGGNRYDGFQSEDPWYRCGQSWRFYDSDQVKIDTFCGVFGVSRSAAAIRLEQLGYLNRKKDYEYRDPLEVWPWAGISEYRNHLRKCRLKSSGQRMQSLPKSPGLSGVLIADTIQLSSLRIPEGMCRPNARSADARPSSMYWRWEDYGDCSSTIRPWMVEMTINNPINTIL